LVGTNITGTATSFNINGTVGATTPAAGAFTTLSASSTLSVTGAGSIQGLTVGRGAGAVSTNTAVGADALAQNSTGAYSTVVGREAGFSTLTSSYNTFIGYRAGFNTTGDQNTFLGKFAGNSVTSGSTNTIVGAFNGNQSSLDIRTASNYTVISDGGGTPHLAAYTGGTVALQGAIPNAGTGITFPATQSASSNANTLDDYEEGTFTPTIIGTSTAGSGTYSVQQGTYTKVGRAVSFRIYLEWSAHTGTGNMAIESLPFTVSGHASVAFGFVSGVTLTAVNYLIGYADSGTTKITLLQTPTGGGSATNVALDTSAAFMVAGTYFV
jgi:hypothetical protein